MFAAVTGTSTTALPLTVTEVPTPRPSAHWVLVRLHRAALNRLDAVLLDGRTAEAPGTIFGADGAGVIAEVGAALSGKPGLQVGAEVILSPSLFWGPSDAAPGPDYEILGSPTHGTHAEFVVVPAGNVYPKPPRLSWEQAAALPLAGLTAWRALMTRGRLSRGETVVVGAASSGVGSLAVQMAAATGAKVIGVTSSPDKAVHALELGAVGVADRTRGDLGQQILALTEGVGADVALDPTGALWQPMVDALRPGGRLVVVGKMAASVGALRVQSVYWKQVDVLGSSMGSPRDFTALLRHVEGHEWAPLVDSTYPLRDISAAYDRLDSPDRVGKVVVDVSGADPAMPALRATELPLPRNAVGRPCSYQPLATA